MFVSVQNQSRPRLIVLLPTGLEGNLALARSVHQLARQNQADVFYLMLVDDDEQTLQISRALATMKAITADGNLSVGSRLVSTPDWLAALRSIYRPGDTLVCQAEQTVRNGFLRVRPLDEFLVDLLPAPVLTLHGFYHPQRQQIRDWTNGLLHWAGFLLIIAAFTLLEIKFEPTVHGTVHAIVLGVFITAEFGAVLLWNRITSH